MDRDIDDVAKRLEARAFLYGDPSSYREGVRAALREVTAGRGSARTRATSRRTVRPARRARAS